MTDTALPTQPATFADAEEVLAQSLPNYESRPQQQGLARAVEAAIASETHLLAKAGCGTGKSLGYLIPSILSGKRVVVSTATKALQDQIAGKDLPFLAEHLPVPFTFALLKGRSNYACLAKASDATCPAAAKVNAALTAHVADAPDDASFLAERDQFEVDLSDSDWRQFTATSEECPGKRECPFGKVCFAEKAKAIARESQVVVVNHALYLTDLLVKVRSRGLATMIGPHDVVVFDECHEIEEYATNALGSRLAEASVTSVVGKIISFSQTALPVGALLAQIEDAGDAAVAAARVLFPALTEGRLRSANLLDQGEEWLAVVNSLGDLDDLFQGPAFLDQANVAQYEDIRKRWGLLASTIENLSRRFREIVTAKFTDLVRWVEVEEIKVTRLAPAGERKVVRSAPIHVGPFLSRNLWDRVEPQDDEGDDEHEPEAVQEITAILTSATLDPAFISGRLGLGGYSSYDAGSPFDFTRQALLYVPSHLPVPTPDNRAAWSSMAINEISELVRASQGRALLLFTSTAQLTATYNQLQGRLPYTLLKQGEAPNPVLAAQFLADSSSVLFATRSFFTGVDFQGDACSLVVIDKLPFPVPTEPIVEARCEDIKARGGSDFQDYTIPTMSLVLEQGFGRLIRHRNDRGCVAILDPRLTSKHYGRQILRNLPPARRVETVAEVAAFLAPVGG